MQSLRCGSFWLLVWSLTVLGCSSLAAQDPSANRTAPPATITPEPAKVNPDAQTDTTYKRILGVIPNYKTFPTMKDYKPITTKEKWSIATQDAFDRGTFALAAVFAGYSQLTNANPSFGQGIKGYSHYFVTSFADWSIGDYMTEAVFPTLLHQDPRYFRRGTGSGPRRLLYAMGQIFWTHTDSGGHTFNFSEIGGNSASVAISQAYYPENRTVGGAVSKLGVQIGMDMTSNIMKEFWPDVQHMLSRKHPHPPVDPAQSPTH